MTEADTPALSTDQVAARLGVKTAVLAKFVGYHPRPTPEVVLDWADADPRHREAVGVWLEARELGKWERDRTVDPERAKLIRDTQRGQK